MKAKAAWAGAFKGTIAFYPYSTNSNLLLTSPLLGQPGQKPAAQAGRRDWWPERTAL
jgi:hypothetical protein